MKVGELRKSFLEFFEKKGHTVVPSGSLVPHNDETLLFTNAGMVPFKEVFLGLDKRAYTKATSSQCCIRAGGKHNDLENVGYTARHHTFFEMLGNFSFGDYFKREAIQYSWEYITEVLNIPPSKLWVSVYQEDDEAADIWLNEIKIDKNRFSRCTDKDNFWSMGDTGPCGPCTEIFYDHGESVAGGPPGSPDEDGDRYIEIWNLVFMQYNRDKAGNLTPLPKPSVDTGMGLERLAAVMQGVHSNYEIDLFVNLIKSIATLLNVQDLEQKSLRVIADHIRATAFLMVDGVMPSNEGRGYVLRRIMRRALRHGNQLGATSPFFNKLINTLVQQMGEAYPKLREKQTYLEKNILKEEEQFAKTLSQGLKIFEQDLTLLKGSLISGETVFKLYDTYGFPVDLTADLARERGLEVDIAGFEHEMAQQRQRARSASQFNVDYNEALQMDAKSQFTGYHSLTEKSEVLDILHDKTKVKEIAEGDKASIILKHTPFYAESGGQVGDQGQLTFEDNCFIVEDTKKVNDAILHIGYVQSGHFTVGQTVSAQVDAPLRKATMLNHSATHLLHAALREIVGAHVVQKGSLVAPDRLRFDFAHDEPLSVSQITQVEQRVNEKILENTQATVTEMTPQQAKEAGALALFGEKYQDIVRVLNMGHGYSIELCGGTHAERTGDIGVFKIISQSGIAAGIRRIEALTGMGAYQWLRDADNLVANLAQQFNVNRAQVEQKLNQVLEKNKELEKEILRLKNKLASGTGGDLASEALDLGECKVLVKELTDVEPNLMRQLIDDLKNKLGCAIIVLATVSEGRVQLIAGVSKNCTKKVNASTLVNYVASQVGGKGGGRPDLAQAGGTQPEKLKEALASVADWVQSQL